MGFEKWLYRIGFGSPGHTARSILKVYLKLLTQYFNENETDVFNEICSRIYESRIHIQLKLRNKGCILQNYTQELDDIITYRDLPLFILAIMELETKSFRSAISDKNIDLVLEVIREEVAKKDDSLISLDYNSYRYYAIQFINKVNLTQQ